MGHVFGTLILGLALCCYSTALSADVIANNLLNLTQLQITASTDSVRLFLNASAFRAVFKSLGESDFGSDALTWPPPARLPSLAIWADQYS
jgi:hypothetical protein